MWFDDVTNPAALKLDELLPHAPFRSISSPLKMPLTSSRLLSWKSGYEEPWTCPGFVDGYGLGFQALCGSCLLS